MEYGHWSVSRRRQRLFSRRTRLPLKEKKGKESKRITLFLLTINQWWLPCAWPQLIGVLVVKRICSCNMLRNLFMHREERKYDGKWGGWGKYENEYLAHDHSTLSNLPGCFGGALSEKLVVFGGLRHDSLRYFIRHLSDRHFIRHLSDRHPIRHLTTWVSVAGVMKRRMRGMNEPTIAKEKG